MKRVISLLLAFVFLVGCVSVPKQIDPKKAKYVKISIKWDSEYKPQSTNTGTLQVINLKTGEKFQIKFKDFRIMQRAYKNWRSVEDSTPVISEIRQEKGKLFLTFNYLDEKKNSILAGEMIIDTSLIRNSKDKQLINILIGLSVGLGTWGIVMSIIFFAVLL